MTTLNAASLLNPLRMMGKVNLLGAEVTDMMPIVALGRAANAGISLIVVTDSDSAATTAVRARNERRGTVKP